MKGSTLEDRVREPDISQQAASAVARFEAEENDRWNRARSFVYRHGDSLAIGSWVYNFVVVFIAYVVSFFTDLTPRAQPIIYYFVITSFFVSFGVFILAICRPSTQSTFKTIIGIASFFGILWLGASCGVAVWRLSS